MTNNKVKKETCTQSKDLCDDNKVWRNDDTKGKIHCFYCICTNFCFELLFGNGGIIQNKSLHPIYVAISTSLITHHHNI